MKTVATLPAAVLGGLLAALASGCATDPTETGTPTPRAERGETITGSHIPNKKATAAQSDVEREKTVQRMKELQERSIPPQKLN